MELVRKTLAKADAEIVSIRKWDERALAYTIRRCDRGTYILTYFRADGQKIRDIERDVQLSDRIMRALILKADHITEDAIAKEALQKTEDPASPHGYAEASGEQKTQLRPEGYAVPGTPNGGQAEDGGQKTEDRGQRTDVPSSVIQEQTRDPSRLGVEPRQDETQP
jgi:small subunit ribosomal protein S6